MSEVSGGVRVITPPGSEPVTLAEARLWCRIDADDTTQDAVLLLLIGAMRRHSEDITGRAFVRRTLQLRLRGFPCTEIELPHPPLISVSSIEYTDGAGSDLNLNGSPSEYRVDADSVPGLVMPIYGGAWPATRGDLASVRITYDCGYASVSGIPAEVRTWIQARISTIYDNREHLIHNNQVEIPRDFADGLLDYLRAARMFA